MANTYLSRTFGTPTNASKFTISVWVKRSALGTAWNIILASYASSTQYSNLAINGNDQFAWHIVNSSEVSKLYSSRLLRDVNGWFHLVFNWDSTQATASNRTKMYVNGEQITSYSTQTNSAQNTNYNMNTAVTHWIGAEKGNPGGSFGNYFNGSMSHYHFIDGTIYDPTAFGETDSTTGEWKIKTSPSVTYGNNGFFILKDGNTITDQSSGSNDWSLVGGTLTKTEDCPSNVFATLNALQKMGNSSFNLTNGNTRFQTTSTSWGNRFSTLAFQSGKFYAEAKVLALNSSQGYAGLGIGDVNDAWYNGDDTLIKQKAASAGTTLDHRSGQSDVRSGASSITSGVGDFSANDIIGLAVDMDNKALYIHKNGTYITIGGVTGVPTSGASKTGAITIPTSVNDCAFVISGYSTDADLCYNFGNGYFLTTAVSSAGTNASGNGIFEHDCPAGFTALSTKGLNL